MIIRNILSVAMVLSACIGFAGGESHVPKGFTDDFDGALKSAAQSRKQLWVLFTGSDWQRECKDLERKILCRPRFASAGSNNFELVYIDFPLDRSRIVDKKFGERNLSLLSKYHVEMYPVILVIDAEGQEAFRADIPSPKETSRNYFKKVARKAKTYSKMRYLDPVEVEFDITAQSVCFTALARMREIMSGLESASIPKSIDAERKDLVSRFKADIERREAQVVSGSPEQDIIVSR